MPKFKVCFAFFPFGNQEAPAVRKWFARTILACKKDPRIGEILDRDFDDTPITMSRNGAERWATGEGADLLCMIDSDMKPDYLVGKDPTAKPFWESSLEFVLNHEGPCVVAAPYQGPPPHENCYVFQWVRQQSDHPNPDYRLAQFTREEAAVRTGIQCVGALPTGLILIDMRAFKRIEPPYFEYEYADPPFNTRKSTTEDVYFTRNLSLAGVPQYCNWDAWAIHHKRKDVTKPVIQTVDAVGEQLRSALAQGWVRGERLLDVSCKDDPAMPPTNGHCPAKLPLLKP